MASFIQKLFGKKDAPAQKGGVSLSQIEQMISQGMSKTQIVDYYRKQGAPLATIERAISQAVAKQNVISGSPVSAPPQQMGGGGAQSPTTFEGVEQSAPDMSLPQMPSMDNEMNIPNMGEAQEQGLPQPPEGLDMPPMPGPQNVPQAPQMPEPEESAQENELARDVDTIGDVEELIEAIVEERLTDVTEKLDEIERIKEQVDTNVSGIDERFSSYDERLAHLEEEQKSANDNYRKTIEEVRLEMGAMEKAMKKLVPTLASNIRELQELQETKKKAASKSSKKK
ncbi:hypothetical protein COT72_03390 [archaeon CG10_big_fil_rev_8_21_14_0_10_43_11]|nr:MAG: hypothetical protein COT72_03390 [archaeon CG10_big_fil_rev_8_21_14_0_10_43_11]